MTITVDGKTVSYITEGEGPDILMLHGWEGCIDSFAPIAQNLRQHFRVTRLDFPGFGGTPAPDEPWSVTEYADWTEKVMDALGITPCHIIAHSFGARVSILLAATRPQLVRRMLFTGAAGLIPKRSAKYYFKVWSYKLLKKMAATAPVAGALRGLGWDVEEKVKKRSGSAEYQRLSGVMRGTFVRVVNQDLKGYLSQIRASVLLFWGEEDRDTPLYFAHIMKENIPDAGLATYPGAGHFAYLERLGDFVAVANSFFSPRDDQHDRSNTGGKP